MGGARLEGEGVADPGHHGQGPYSNSTPPPLKCASCWNFWHRGGTGETGLDFFSLLFLRGWEVFFSLEGEGREKKVFFFLLTSFLLEGGVED